MKATNRHSARLTTQILRLLGFLVFFLFVSSATLAQNTKGDRPVKNDRQIRETKVKSVRKKEKRRTRDIANRRLRTRNQSSANRANAKYPQPSPYTNRTRLHEDKPGKPRGRVFSQSPRESSTRPWKGDVSGYPLKRIKPNRNEAARSNVYPQHGQFVRKKVKEERPVRLTRNTRGRRVGQQKPKYEERAWKGGIDKGPLRNRSVSASIRNVYPKKGKYTAYARKRLNEKERAVSNHKELAQLRTLSRTPRAGARSGGGLGVLSRPFIQKGKKNVYWGKFSRKERPYTRDITGGPLRTRNFKTALPGRVGRDTLKFFGRKPLGDRSSRVPSGGYQTITQSGRWWKGDVAGWQLRKSKRNKGEHVGAFFFKRKLSISETGERSGSALPGAGFKSGTKRGDRPVLRSNPSLYLERNLSGKGKGGKRPKAGINISKKGGNNGGQPLLGRAPGIGAAGIGNYRGRSPRGAGFSKQGAGYSGNIRRGSIGGFSKDGVDYSGRIKRSQINGFSRQGANYSGNTRRGSIGGFSKDGVDYSGKIKRSQIRGFSKDGVDYSGNIRRGSIGGFSKNGVDYSGKIKRSQIRGFSKDGVDYSGNIRRGSIGGFSKNGVDYSGKIKRSQVNGFSRQGSNYSGNIRRGTVRGFGEMGAGFSGNIKQARPSKGGGSVSGLVWNNDRRSVTRSTLTPQGRMALRYPGNIEYVGRIKTFEENGVGYSGKIKRSSLNGFGRQGADFAGNLKTKRPQKGGGSVSGQRWNNDRKPIEGRTPGSLQGIDFAGNIKTHRPDKGGGSVSGQQWNNDRKPIEGRRPGSLQGIDFSGNIKTRRPEKGGGSVSGKHWNNEQKPIEVRMPSGDARATNYSGRISVSRFKKNYVQNPNASTESLKKKRPDETTYRVAGLMVKVREHNYSKKPNASKNSLPGIAPTRSSVKASEYAKGMKQYWHYKHNPNSAQGALKVIEPGKAMARINDYQGNIKMHKYSGNRLHPDAQFAHGYRDNVKEERTLLMNMKLMWSRLFRKSETQPENLKEKIRRPRYDKREKGLWYD